MLITVDSISMQITETIEHECPLMHTQNCFKYEKKKSFLRESKLAIKFHIPKMIKKLKLKLGFLNRHENLL